MLWSHSLVMYDQETGSYWSHLLGKAMEGPLKGARLKPIPSVMTDWDSWASEHPKTTLALLPQTYRLYSRQWYRNLDDYVLGIASEDEAKAWSLGRLAKEPVRHDTWAGQEVVVVFEAKSVTARLFSRRVSDRLLTFRLEDSVLADNETGTTWSPISGRGLEGPLAQLHLTPLPAILSDRYAWFLFYPRTELR